MSQRVVTLAGVVLPGPTMTPPYATDARCVIWAAGTDEHDEGASSGALPFHLLADDGRELRIEPAGAAASLPVRLRLAFDRPAAGPGGSPAAPAWKRRGKATTESHVAAWLAVGERIDVVGRLAGAANPFRRHAIVVASALRVAGTPVLRVGALEPGEPET